MSLFFFEKLPIYSSSIMTIQKTIEVIKISLSNSHLEFFKDVTSKLRQIYNASTKNKKTRTQEK